MTEASQSKKNYLKSLYTWVFKSNELPRFRDELSGSRHSRSVPSLQHYRQQRVSTATFETSASDASQSTSTKIRASERFLASTGQGGYSQNFVRKTNDHNLYSVRIIVKNIQIIVTILRIIIRKRCSQKLQEFSQKRFY